MLRVGEGTLFAAKNNKRKADIINGAEGSDMNYNFMTFRFLTKLPVKILNR